MLGSLRFPEVFTLKLPTATQIREWLYKKQNFQDCERCNGFRFYFASSLIKTFHVKTIFQQNIWSSACHAS